VLTSGVTKINLIESFGELLLLLKIIKKDLPDFCQ